MESLDLIMKTHHILSHIIIDHNECETNKKNINHMLCFVKCVKYDFLQLFSTIFGIQISIIKKQHLHDYL